MLQVLNKRCKYSSWVNSSANGALLCPQGRLESKPLALSFAEIHQEKWVNKNAKVKLLTSKKPIPSAALIALCSLWEQVYKTYFELWWSWGFSPILEMRRWRLSECNNLICIHLASKLQGRDTQHLAHSAYGFLSVQPFGFELSTCNMPFQVKEWHFQG